MQIKKVRCVICNSLCVSAEKEPMCINCLHSDHEKNSKRKCHHCGLLRIPIKQKWGKLCFECNMNPDIKVFYYRVPSDVLHELDEEGVDFPLASEPTTASPGSEEKIKIFQERAKLKVALFHPQDHSEVNYLTKAIQKIIKRYKYNDGSSNCRTAQELRDSKREFHYSY